MRISSDGESRLHKNGKGFLVRLLEALHRSRRRNTIQLLRRYRHLIAGQAQVRPASRVPQSRPAGKSSRSDHESGTPNPAIRRVRQKA
ncbi:hypothetical protein [Bradyrhizobium roseum]|uniref:hypothetical protein n=1 Tax=Bradyrhizobium roseum TaxID=3056648 RepID=UPI00260FC562|nr:hypothetical protein [Bradyrhizobium roseus]WKA28166.1 hypothetical protein QUH67_32265 [Bradyrhizobium roseus]